MSSEDYIFNSEIISVKNNNNIFKLSSPINIISPKMRVMYPIQQRYGQIIMKLEFSRIKERTEIAEFYNLVQDIESHYAQKFFKYKNKTYNIKSQINQIKHYCPFLIVKVPMLNKRPNIDVECPKESGITTIYDIKQNYYISACIYIDTIWVNNDTNEIIIKWKARKIYMM